MHPVRMCRVVLTSNTFEANTPSCRPPVSLGGCLFQVGQGDSRLPEAAGSRQGAPKHLVLLSRSSFQEFAEQFLIKFDTRVLASQFLTDPLEYAQLLPVAVRANLEDLEAAPDGSWDLVDVIRGGYPDHVAGIYPQVATGVFKELGGFRF